MFSLVTDKNEKKLRKWERIYLAVSLFFLLFGFVYEHYSHGVYSYFMIYAFALPLVGGQSVCVLLQYFCRKRMPGSLPLQLYNFGLAALTVGCVVQGVLEIYGTANRLVAVYWIVGAVLLWSGIHSYIYGLSKA